MVKHIYSLLTVFQRSERPNYMVCDIYRAQNRLVFCVLVVGVFVFVQNCKFFAEIWAQGEFCVF